VRGWLLDTNVVAELGRPQAARSLLVWAQAQPETRLFIGVLTLGEYEKGLAFMPRNAPGRARLDASVRALEMRFAGRILSLSDAIVRRWGRVSGLIKRTTGQSPPVIDILLAATAIEHGLYFVTRNVRDVTHSGAAVFNPWQDDPERFAIS
jgi:toxin FitB